MNKRHVFFIALVALAIIGCGANAHNNTHSAQALSLNPMPTPTPQPLPSIGGWYEFSYTIQDYLQTTYTVYLDVNDGIEIKAGLHTWNDNDMHEQRCTNIHSYTDLTFSVLNTTQVDVEGSLVDRGKYTVQSGGFLSRNYVDAEGQISTYVLTPTTEDSYKSDIAALHAQAPDCTASDF